MEPVKEVAPSMQPVKDVTPPAPDAFSYKDDNSRPRYETLSFDDLISSAEKGYANDKLTSDIQKAVARYNKVQLPNVVMGNTNGANNANNANVIRNSLLYVAQMPDSRLNNLGILGIVGRDIADPLIMAMSTKQGLANMGNMATKKWSKTKGGRKQKQNKRKTKRTRKL